MKNNIIISFSLFVILFIWLASGYFKKDNDSPLAKTTQSQTPSVTIKELTAKKIFEEIAVSGKTQPKRSVTIRAENEGTITEIAAEKGAYLNRGDIILKIDTKTLPVKRSEAAALVSQREIEYSAAQKLLKQNLLSEAKVAEAFFNLETARAKLAEINLNLHNTTIVSPIEGILNSRPAEVGNYISIGEEVASVIQINPLIAKAEITQRDINKVKLGLKSTITLNNGETLSGPISFIEQNSDPNSRTFSVEIEVDNPNYRPAGESIKISIPTNEVYAHKISQAMLSINDLGDIGVKVIDEDNRVQFFPADIIKTSSKSLWLKDLPEKIKIITQGQGFSAVGDSVNTDEN